MSGVGAYIKNGINRLFGKKGSVTEQAAKEDTYFGEYYDLYPVLTDVVDMLKEEAEKKGLETSLDLAWSTPKQLYGDEKKFGDAVKELISAAVDSADHGKVVFGISFDKCDDDPECADLKINVMCSGAGIGEDRLFLLKDHLHSAGCGLNAENVSDLGAKYSFSIRQKVAAWEPLGSFENAYNAEIKNRGTKRVKFIAPEAEILIIDDNPMNLEVIRSLLKDSRVKTDTAESGDRGIALAREKEYDIVFLDHMMPDKDGIETLKELKQAGERRNTTMVCLTANAISGAKKWYLSEGFDDYLAKPVNAEKLEAILLKHLPEDKIIRGAEYYNG